MKSHRLIFIFLCTTTLVSACESTEDFTDRIAELNVGNVIYDQVNEEGLHYLLSGKHEQALERYNLVLAEHESKPVSEMAFGRALWGKMICHGAMEQKDEFLADMEKVRNFSTKHNELSSNNQPINDYQSGWDSNEWRQRQSNEHYPLKNLPFRDSTRRIETKDCKDRVVGTRDKIVYGIQSVIPCKYIRDQLIDFIDGLAADCLNCCWNGTFWTECVGRIMMYLINWKVYGIPLTPPWH